MNLIKYAYENQNKRVKRTKCGWDFETRISLESQIVLVEPFEHPCQTCNFITNISELNQYCENCYNSDVYEYDKHKLINKKIKEFDFEILDSKNTNYCDVSTVYKIKIEEFYGLVFCGLFEEPNEWSSSPHDDYWYLTFLFINEESCNAEFLTLNIVKDYL